VIVHLRAINWELESGKKTRTVQKDSKQVQNGDCKFVDNMEVQVGEDLFAFPLSGSERMVAFKHDRKICGELRKQSVLLLLSTLPQLLRPS
jgi:hypothetical protein